MKCLYEWYGVVVVFSAFAKLVLVCVLTLKVPCVKCRQLLLL